MSENRLPKCKQSIKNLFLISIDRKPYYSYNTDINRISYIIQLPDKVCGDTMISFNNFKIDGNDPIYIQILLHIKRGIVAGRVMMVTNFRHDAFSRHFLA